MKKLLLMLILALAVTGCATLGTAWQDVAEDPIAFHQDAAEASRNINAILGILGIGGTGLGIGLGYVIAAKKRILQANKAQKLAKGK
jgi:hypothetical protein